MGPSGAQLGTATGRITIDTRDLAKVEAFAQQVGQSVARSLGQIDAGAKRASGGIGALSGSLGGLLGGFSAIRIGQFILQADQLATAYKRQNVAATSLAGGQEELNQLLDAYDKATGKAIAKADQMAAVTKLQAIGFADSAQELDEFVTAARGASLAMGLSQEYIVSQLQLTIANQSKLRLDQIGLGIAEVEGRVNRLKSADGGLTDQMAYQNAVLGLLQEKFGGLVKSQAGLATGAEKMAKAWKDASLEIGEAFGPEISTSLEGASTQITGISRNLRDLKTDIDNVKQGLRDEGGIGGDSWLSKILNFDVSFGLGQMELTTRRGQGLALVQRRDYSRASATSGGGSYIGGPGGQGIGPAPIDPHLEDRRAAAIDYQRQLADIERDAQSARLDATRQYESQRSSTIREFEKSVAREEADWLLQRGRAVAEFNESVADLQADAAKRDARLESDYADRTAEIRSDAAKRLSDIEEDYQRNRERAERNFRYRLSDAAARLDAVAVVQEQRNFKRQSEDAKDAHDEQVSDLQEQIAERLDQERKAHERQLQDNRDADAQRLADMQEAFVEQRQQEEEDRRIRLERQAQDHVDQLAEMDRAQGERLAQIAQHEAEERKAAEDAHLQEMAELGVVLSTGWALVQKSIEAQMLKEYEDFKKKLEERFKQPRQDKYGNLTDTPYMPEYASGGWVNQTGPAYLHAGEYVASARMAQNIANNSMGNVAINIYGAPGQSADDIGRAVRGELEGLFRGMLN